MSVLKKKITEDFTVVHNAFIKDTGMPLAAKGLLIVMLSLPDNWDFSIAGLKALLPDGKDKVRTTLKDLENMGYLRRSRINDEKGHIIDWEYCFSDEPIFREEKAEETEIAVNSDPYPHSEKPKVDENGYNGPHSDFPQLVKPQLAGPNQAQPVVAEPTAYKILNNQILKNQELTDQISCDAVADMAAACEQTSLIEGIKERASARSPKKKFSDEVYEEIIAYLNAKTGSAFKNCKSNRKYIETRLKEGYSVDDFKRVIDRKVAQWNGTRFAANLCPSTLFGDHFDGYLNAPETQPIGTPVTPKEPDYSVDMMDLLNAYLEE